MNGSGVGLVLADVEDLDLVLHVGVHVAAEVAVVQLSCCS
jgi:hypothetical protein